MVLPRGSPEAYHATWWERFVAMLLWALPGHWLISRRYLTRLIGRKPGFRLLDIGGRKSLYTVGLPCRVHIIDLPRQSELQRTLHLGLNDEALADINKKRSNVVEVRLEDILDTTYPEDYFDGAVAIEVIEHIEKDSAFLAQVCRVLRPGGWLLLTTPNGEAVPCVNPDHVRHYTIDALKVKLEQCFRNVEVWPEVKHDRLQRFGAKPWLTRWCSKRVPRLRAPLVLVCALLANLRNALRAPRRDHAGHLFALGTKAQS